MASENTSLSYTGKDQVDIRRELINLVPELTENWRDFSESDLGVTVVELIAGAQDLQNFYFDNQAFETFLDTAQQDKNIRSHLRAMNYKIPFMGSAKGDLDIYFTSMGAAKDSNYKGVYFPKYAQLVCLDGDIKYAVKDGITLKPSTLITDENSPYFGKYKADKQLPVIEGTVRHFNVTRKILSSRMTVDGEVSRRIYLEGGDAHNYSDSTVWIDHRYGSGDRKDEVRELWTEVEDAILEYNGGAVYSVHVDSDGEPYILMSVDFLDYIGETDIITIYWIQTLGLKGIAEVGTDKQISKFMSFKDNNGKDVTVSQTVSTYGAYDIPDLSTLKPLARRQAQNLGRYITIDDYKNGVATEPYVFRYVVKDWKSPSYVSLPYQVKIWAVDGTGNNLGTQDIKSLKSKLYNKGVTDIEIIYMLTEFVKIRIDINLVLKVSTEANQEALKSLVEDSITEMFDYLNLNYGEHISLMLLDSQVRALSSYIKSAQINLYQGVTENITKFSGYSDTKIKDIPMSLSMSQTEKQDAIDRVDKIIRDLSGGISEVANDYNLVTLESTRDLEVVTWKEVGDVVLDEIEFPLIYQINVTSTQEDSGVEI